MNMVKDAKEYAAQLVAFGATFEDFEEQWPNLAGSEYGELVKTEMEKLKG